MPIRTDATDRTMPSPSASARERVAFAAVLLALQLAFFSDSLRPGYVLSAADWLLVTESFSGTVARDYEPANRLLTDVACQMQPWSDLAARTWQSGRVPLWNPYAGAGAPLLANAQSAVFYPFQWVYFLTHSPVAWVAIAMLKLWLAGLGAFLLAEHYQLGRMGRWFAGLTFPFCGFLVVWLQYPMGGVAIWLPWMVWFVERLVAKPCAARAIPPAALVGLMHLGGHPETTAHVLLVVVAVAFWRSLPWVRGGFDQRTVISRPVDPLTMPSPRRGEGAMVSLGEAARGDWVSESERGDEPKPLRRAILLFSWLAAAIATGFLLGGVQLVPLAEYLAQSQAWSDRSQDVRGVWVFRMPEAMAVPALALPYVYGSYVRGHPHVEKVVGVENFNEIAGGYVGLATIALLVPLALVARPRPRWIQFWVLLDLIALAVVYRVPIVDNVVRCIPVLNVTQNQRLLLVVALAHCLLGAAGLESWREFGSSERHRRWRRGLAGLLILGGGLLGAAATVVYVAAPRIRDKAIEHFERQAELRGLEADALRARAERQARQVVEFFPRYYLVVAASAAALAGLAVARHRAIPGVVLVLTVCDLFLFGRGYNPAIPIDRHFPEGPVTRFLHDASRQSQAPFRVLPLEEEFPPNVLAQYRIPDLRNYDAIEVRHVLRYFEPLWPESSGDRTSNAWVPWDAVLAARDPLRAGNVRYVVSIHRPPAAARDIRLVFEHGTVGVYELEAPGPIFAAASLEPPGAIEPVRSTIHRYEPGRVEATVELQDERWVVLSETCMPGWRAWIDGADVELGCYGDAFVALRAGPGRHRVLFEYAPASFRWGLAMSAIGLAAFAVMLIAAWRERR